MNMYEEFKKEFTCEQCKLPATAIWHYTDDYNGDRYTEAFCDTHGAELAKEAPQYKALRNHPQLHTHDFSESKHNNECACGAKLNKEPTNV